MTVNAARLHQVYYGLVHLHMPLVVLLQLAKEVIPYHALLTRHSLKHLLDTCITQYTNENLQQDNQLSHAAAV